MGIFDDAVPGGSISKPIMIALGALLVGKLLGGGAGQDTSATQQQPGATPQGGDGGLMGGLGGLLGKLTEAGHGDAVDSWVKPGANQPISPGSLGNALGSQTISDLARKAGVSEDELLQQLSRVLPGVVDKVTPQGQIPGLEQLSSLFRS
ncbi:YidB family protein [Rhizobium sp. RAF56]|uniref:YidB family protein n=1 Tax=Rhizobium sp. RAF56 TaxID=3233062 RepID=UPI003F952DFA